MITQAQDPFGGFLCVIHSLARVGIPIAGESVVAGTQVFELQPSASPRVSGKANRGVSLSDILR